MLHGCLPQPAAPSSSAEPLDPREGLAILQVSKGVGYGPPQPTPNAHPGRGLVTWDKRTHFFIFRGGARIGVS